MSIISINRPAPVRQPPITFDVQGLSITEFKCLHAMMGRSTGVFADLFNKFDTALRAENLNTGVDVITIDGDRIPTIHFKER